MKERPILFSGPMVHAILEGRKTQTRRLVKPQPITWDWPEMRERLKSQELLNTCPDGQPGDRLWVRESWMDADIPEGMMGADQVVRGPVSNRMPRGWIRCAWHKGVPDPLGWPVRRGWKSPIHMPRWASRITLEITGVRVERLQEISDEDAFAEGAMFHDGRGIGHSGWRHDNNHGFVYANASESFARLWQSIHGPGSWDANPWVWVIEFKRV